MAVKPLVPKVTQPWLVPFARWADDNAYVIDCVAENIRTALSAAATAAGLILNANPALAQWQGFATGGG